jgi:hypothetical protein
VQHDVNDTPQEAVPFRFLWYAGEWPTALSALRHANFRYFWFGQLVSLMGTWMQNTAQSWLVYQLAKSEYGAVNASFTWGLSARWAARPCSC